MNIQQVKNACALRARPAVAALNRPLSLKFQITTDDIAEAPSGEIDIAWEAPRQGLQGSLTGAFDRRGNMETRFVAPKNIREGTVLFRPALHDGEPPCAGISLHSIEVVEEIERLRSRIELRTPNRICFVGDSLTALNPQSNYLALLKRILGERFGDDLQMIGSGVGGDSIERIEKRLEETVIAHRPDWAFILTGANDSKIAWHAEKKAYGACFVPPERFTASFRRVIERLRGAGVGRISVISATASYEPTCRDIHEMKKAKGQTHNFFGRPDLLEKYNALMKSVALEFGLDFVDVYTPMRNSPEWPLFTDESGVHLAESGERFLAVELLRYLAGQRQS